jgi:methionyl aminopeptidase
MITMKTAEDFRKMEVAGRVVAEVLDAVREKAAPGVTTRELDAIAERIIRDHDCTPSFLGYHGFPGSICASPNSMIVHGIPGDYRLRPGDVLSIDAGAIYEGWHGDAARTWAIGEVPDEVQQLIETTAACLDAGIAQTMAGKRLGDIGHAIQTLAESNGFSVVREYIGHGIGRQMHESPQVPNYGAPGKGLKLKTGMAICIEPMLNIGGHETVTLDDNWSVVTADGSLSAHFEDTIGLTPDGPRVFTRP